MPTVQENVAQTGLIIEASSQQRNVTQSGLMVETSAEQRNVAMVGLMVDVYNVVSTTKPRSFAVMCG
jgi:hypothetical protein